MSDSENRESSGSVVHDVGQTYLAFIDFKIILFIIVAVIILIVVFAYPAKEKMCDSCSGGR